MDALIVDEQYYCGRPSHLAVDVMVVVQRLVTALNSFFNTTGWMGVELSSMVFEELL
jgi:hypothetical protein